MPQTAKIAVEPRKSPVQVGSVSSDEIQLPSAALRSSSLVLMVSGLKSVPMVTLLAAIDSVFKANVSAKPQIAIKRVPPAQVEEIWSDVGRESVVFVVG